ncbi:hypothetical protein H4R33_004371 [Dimargaris cristalligena]|nr:hypothetical protein H4R33_004371 [Dimargaris cristalligena]
MIQPPVLEVSLLTGPDHIFHNNETITGAVKLKTYARFVARRIVLCFIGQEKVALSANSNGDRCLKKVYYQQELVVWGDQLGTYEKVINPGTHCFPFNCQLPLMNYPGSTSRSASADNTCPDFVIEYVFQAGVECRNAQVLSSVVPILYEPVLWPSVSFDRNSVVVAETEAHMAQGIVADQDGKEPSYQIKGVFSKREYQAGDLVQVELEISHKSGTVRVMEALCSLEETIECHLDGRAHSHHPGRKPVWNSRRNLGIDYPEPLDLPKPVPVVSPIKARRRAISNAATSLLAMRSPSGEQHSIPDKEPVNAFSSSSGSDRPYRCVARIRLPHDLRPLSAGHLSFRYDLIVDLKVPNGYFKRKSAKMVRATFPIHIATVDRKVAEMVASVRQSSKSNLSSSTLFHSSSPPAHLPDLPSVLQTPMVVANGLDHPYISRGKPYLSFSDDDPALWVPVTSAKIISLPDTPQATPPKTQSHIRQPSDHKQFILIGSNRSSTGDELTDDDCTVVNECTGYVSQYSQAYVL